MSRGGERGFTLIEALVAMAVLGLVLVTLLSATAHALRAEAQASDHLTAVTLADAKMNELTSLPLSEMAVYAHPVSGRFPRELSGFTWSAQVVRSAESTRLYEATVSVGWDGGRFDLQTAVYRVGRVGVAQASP